MPIIIWSFVIKTIHKLRNEFCGNIFYEQDHEFVYILKSDANEYVY